MKCDVGLIHQEKYMTQHPLAIIINMSIFAT